MRGVDNLGLGGCAEDFNVLAAEERALEVWMFEDPRFATAPELLLLLELVVEFLSGLGNFSETDSVIELELVSDESVVVVGEED